MKITATEFNNIFGTHKSNALEFTMTKDNNGFHFEERVKPWLFVLMFLPIVICQFFYLLWDGGLKEYELPTQRVVSSWTMYVCDAEYENSMYNKMKKVWERA